MKYSPEAIRVKVMRRWWSVLYPLEWCNMANAWRRFLHHKPDQRALVEGFMEIERECSVSFAWVVHVGSWLLYRTDEVHYMVKHDDHAGRNARINMHGSHASMPNHDAVAGGRVASRSSRSSRSGRARFSVKSA